MGTEKLVVIDGCFLSCMARVLENVIDKDRIIHIDTNPLYEGYTDTFLFTDVPEKTRKELARKVADKMLEKLREEYAPVNRENFA